MSIKCGFRSSEKRVPLGNATVVCECGTCFYGVVVVVHEVLVLSLRALTLAPLVPSSASTVRFIPMFPRSLPGLQYYQIRRPLASFLPQCIGGGGESLAAYDFLLSNGN